MFLRRDLRHDADYFANLTMKIDPMRLQRMNSSFELKKKHDRGLQSILVCL